MRVDADRSPQPVADEADPLAHGVGQRAAVGIAEHEAVGAGRRRRIEGGQGILRVKLAAIEECSAS